jgi:O-antigen/teichoic acid export membrane protein
MKIERTKNATRNIIFGGLLKIYQIVIPFVMRTVMIYFLGIQYLGLNSLFTSILQVLNLAELGVGSAMVYSMYKPIVEDDKERICSLMRLYRTYYRVIGLIIAVAGTILTPFVPHLIKGDVPADMNVYILYLLNLGATVLSYWLFAYKNSLFSAFQRQDVVSKVTLATNTVQYILQIVAIVRLHNYYVYVIILLAGQALTNIVTAIAATVMYPDLQPGEKLDKESVREINHRIRDLFTSKIGAVVVNSADTIVISAFLGLTVLAEYQNYYYIMSAVIGMVSIIWASCTAGIGNSLIVETKEKNLHDLQKFTFMISWIAGVCCCCFLNLYQPFMKLWVGENYMFGIGVVICLVIYYYIFEINQLLNMYKDAGGIWHQDRFRPLVTAFANLGMNLIMVQFWGIYGIVLSTALSMAFVGMPWIFHNLFTTLFERKQFKMYFKELLRYTVAAAFITAVSGIICIPIDFASIPTLIIRAVICLVVSNIYYVLIFRKNKEFKESVQMFDKITKHKIPVLRKLAA